MECARLSSIRKQLGPPCRKCGTCATRASRRHGLHEDVLSVLAVYAFRCQLCATRFLARAVEPAPPNGSRAIELREFDRLPVALPLALVREEAHVAFTSADLTVRGCGVDSW